MAREYKDSGIEWIGLIPKEWKLAALKQIGTYINGYAFKPEDWTDSGKPIIRIQDLTGSMGSPNFYNGELDSKYLVSKGDILVSWAATLDAFIWEKEEGWLNQHIFKALPSCDVNYKFFYWLIKLAMENMNNDNKHGIFIAISMLMPPRAAIAAAACSLVIPLAVILFIIAFEICCSSICGK